MVRSTAIWGSMKVLQVHNRYRVRGGEDTTFDATFGLLQRRSVAVCALVRDSRSIPDSPCARAAAFLTGIYSRSALKATVGLLEKERPDVVHVHNLYPLLSPSVLVACRRARVPVVMRCPNFRLICPTGELFSHGEVCERCLGGREYMCILRNCREDILESVAYAVRCMAARKLHWFTDNVAVFVSPSDFVKRRLADAGLNPDRLVVLPHFVSLPHGAADPVSGDYAAYVGRVTVEKGVEALLQAARQCPELPVRIAGDHSLRADLLAAAPRNVQFVGRLEREEVAQFYRKARFLVVPSLSLETFSLVAAEAMAHGLPVLASRIGGLPEVVDDGVTGLLFEPGNAEELSGLMRCLWRDAALCARLGQAGRQKAMREYAEDVHYARLIGVYEKAMGLRQAEQRTDPVG